jgi:hypothetical protein
LIASKGLSFINYLCFLATGSYPNLLLRIVGLDMVASSTGPAQKSSQVYIESRKMLWLTMMVCFFTSLMSYFDFETDCFLSIRERRQHWR